MSVSRKLLLVFVFIIALAPATVNAWLYPEHRDITLLALDTLKPEERSVLDALWSDARVGHEMRLCAQIALPFLFARPGLKPSLAVLWWV